MTLVKCPNGHYYDSSRFGNNCPHCGMSGAASIGADQTTVPLNIPDAPQPANEVTEPLTVSQPVVSQPTNVTAPTVSDDDRTLPVTADMLDGMAEKPAPVVGWLVCTDGVCILGDNTVSRSSHAIVVYDPRSNVYLAQPGSSKELFYVNDMLVLNPVELKTMDLLNIGDTKLMFVPLCGEQFHW